MTANPRIDLPLKHYQAAAITRLGEWLRMARQESREDGEGREGREAAAVAFTRLTGRPYRHAPLVARGTPYACLRIPTGGGKTLVAAHSIGLVAREWLHTTTPLVLWLVPSEAILQQTLGALRNVRNPYRAALAEVFGMGVCVLTRTEALALSLADASGCACIIVSTIQAFRREKDSGAANPDGLKVYEDSGALMEHFRGLPETACARLHAQEGTGRPVYSLANVLRLHRPMVIVDEAHNARTALSFDTLERFSPRLILELTATPQLVHDPERGRHGSNVLYEVSAAELKTEEMIKMPIRLTTHRDWRKTVGAACDAQVALEQAARAEARETGEYLRPVVLIQAQSAAKGDPQRLTWELLEKYLIEERGIPREQVAVHTGPRQDLDNLGEDIRSPQCPLRYVITVQKLKEGWDCPFAYILCSVAEQLSPVAVEQILGRVLRMPRAQRKQRDALNQAYAFVSAQSFDAAAKRLRDGLVEGAGFDPLEAAGMLAAGGLLPLDEGAEAQPYESGPLVSEELPVEELAQTIAQLPAAMKSRTQFVEEAGTVVWQGPMSREHHSHLRMVFSRSRKAIRAIDQLYLVSNRVATAGGMRESETADGEEAHKPAFIVPLLGWRPRSGGGGTFGETAGEQGTFLLEPFQKAHFLSTIWRLDECDEAGVLRHFRPTDRGQRGLIDVEQQMQIRFERHVEGDEVAAVHEPTWSEARLIRFLDSAPHPDYTKASASVFIVRALERLQQEGGFGFEELVRHRFDLAHALHETIAELRKVREAQSYAALFAENAEAPGHFAMSADLALVFDEYRYAFNQPYRGTTEFRKHYFPIIGDLKSEGEEFDCAVYLDRLEAVRYWLRNVENKPHAFWLQLPSGRFYPDFVAMLHDGRTLVVEYKGAHLYEMDKDKRTIGEMWAETSEGQCLFCMPTNRDFSPIDAVIAGPR